MFCPMLGDEHPRPASAASDTSSQSTSASPSSLAAPDEASPWPRVGGWGPLLFFFGFLAGLIGWLHVKARDQRRADHILKWGLIWTLVTGVAYSLLGVSLYLWVIQSVSSTLARVPTLTETAVTTAPTTTSKASGLYTGLSVFGSSGSVAQAEQEIKANPSSAQGYRDLATAYEAKNDAADAITALRSYTALRKNDARAFAELGGLQLTQAADDMSRYNAAVAAQRAAAPSQPATPNGKLGTAVGTNPVNQAAAQPTSGAIADLHQRTMLAYKQAVRSYQVVVKLQPNDPNGRFQLAQAAQSAGENGVAVKAYQAYLKMQPDSSSAAAIRQVIVELSGKK
jgi:tetratricopeptide (TPR) repeat protein